MLQRQGIAALPGFPGLFRGDLGTQAYKLAGEEAQEPSAAVRGRVLPYPVELPAQAVQGLQLALPADVGLVHGEILAAILFCQQAACLAASYLGARW